MLTGHLRWLQWNSSDAHPRTIAQSEWTSSTGKTCFTEISFDIFWSAYEMLQLQYPPTSNAQMGPNTSPLPQGGGFPCLIRLLPTAPPPPHPHPINPVVLKGPQLYSFFIVPIVQPFQGTKGRCLRGGGGREWSTYASWRLVGPNSQHLLAEGPVTIIASPWCMHDLVMPILLEEYLHSRFHTLLDNTVQNYSTVSGSSF